MYYQARQTLEKARQEKHGRHPTILSRWYADEEYRKSLSATGWKEHHMMLYDRIAVEKHIYTATRAVRIQNSKHWILTTIAEGGTQQSLNQRPDFTQAKRECERLHDEHLTRTKKNTEPFLAVNKEDSEKDTKLRATKNMTSWLTLKHVGGSTKGRGSTCRQFRQDSRANLHTASASSSTWDQPHWKTSNWNSKHSSSPDHC